MSANTQYPAPVYCGENVYIRPNYFVTKPEFIGYGFKRSQRQIDNQKNLKENSTGNELSPKAIKRLKNSVNWLLVSSKYKSVYSVRDRKNFWFKVNFITLTIPPQSGQVISSRLFQRCLNSFLVYSRKFRQLHNYVWKLEAHKDGRLHVHITTDIFYHYRDLRSVWNRILTKAGLLNDHFEKYGNYDPNSTDVHAVYKCKNVSAYICGYMQKKPELPEEFKGRIWGCSYSLSDRNKCSTFIEKGSDRRNLAFVDRPAIKYKPILSKVDCMGRQKTIGGLYMLTETQWSTDMDGIIREAFNNHRARIRAGTVPQPKEYMQIDFFQHNQKPISEIVETCETSTSTAKSGKIQFALEF